MLNVSEYALRSNEKSLHNGGRDTVYHLAIVFSHKYYGTNIITGRNFDTDARHDFKRVVDAESLAKEKKNWTTVYDK